MEGLNLIDKIFTTKGGKIAFRIWDIAGEKSHFILFQIFFISRKMIQICSYSKVTINILIMSPLLVKMP